MLLNSLFSFSLLHVFLMRYSANFILLMSLLRKAAALIQHIGRYRSRSETKRLFAREHTTT